MPTKTQLEQIAYNHAAAMMFSDLGTHENGYSAYLYLCERAEKVKIPTNSCLTTFQLGGPSKIGICSMF